MSVEQEVYITELFFVYKSCLTDIQQEVFNLYYLCDLSLAEIAQIKNMSRQGVSDSINKAKKQLLELESAIGYNKKKTAINQLIGGLIENENPIYSQIKSILEEC